jgi:hypothetical protein
VVLYEYLPFQTHFDTIQVSSLNASGDYVFTGVDYGNYLVKVFANAVVPNAVPTYYGDQSLWNALPSEIVNHSCTDSDTLDITLIEIPVLTGPGSLSGNVSKGPGFGNSPTKKTPPYVGERSDPIPGIDVKLGKKPGGSAAIVGQTITDASGDYVFSNLPLDTTYVVYVDIPGLGRDSSYVVKLTAADPVILDLDYIADSTVVYIDTTGISTSINNLAKTVNPNTLTVYPNPSNGITTIEYVLNMDANVSLNVYNVLGVKVLETVNDDQSGGTYKYTINARKSNLNPGIYFITLVIDGKANTQRLVITE